MVSKREREDRERRRVEYGDARANAEKVLAAMDSGAVRLPEGLKFFSVKAAKKVRIDVLPYRVTKGKEQKGGNPAVSTGKVWYERTYYCHPKIGIESKTYCCLRTFGKRCPVCDDRAALKRDPDFDPKLVKDLEPKIRQLFLIIDHADQEGGIKVFDYSYHLFGKQLLAKIDGGDPDDRFDEFYHLDGHYLKVSFSEEPGQGYKYYKASSIEMKQRAEPLEESIIDTNPSLDDMLVELSYDRLKKIYDQSDDEDDEEAAKPKGKGKAKPDDDDEDEDDPKPVKAAKKSPPPDEDDEDDDPKPAKKGKAKEDDEDVVKPKVGDIVEHEEFGECEVVKVDAENEKCDLKDEEGDLKRKVWWTEIKPVVKKKKAKAKPADDDEDDDDEPKPKAKPKAKPAASDDDDEDDDETDWPDDDEDEDDPKPKAKASKPKPKAKPADDDEDDDEPVPVKRGRGRPPKNR